MAMGGFRSIMERSGEYDVCVEKAGCGDCLACERRGQRRAKKEKGPFKALDGELGGTAIALFLLYSGFLCFRLFVLWGAGGGDKMVLECVGRFPHRFGWLFRPLFTFAKR